MLNNTLYSVTLPAVYCRPFALKAVFSERFWRIVDDANSNSSTFTTKNSTFTTHTQKNKPKQKTKKQSVQKQIVWDPCCQHGSVKEKNTVLSPLFPKIKVRENERNIENRF